MTDTFAENINNTLFKNDRRQVEHFGPIAAEREGNVGIYQSYTFESCDDVVQFGGVRLEELTSRWDVIKEIFDNKVTSHRAGARFLTREL